MSVTLSAKALAISASVLYVKVAATVAIQGGKTFAAGGRPPEDAKLKLAKNYPGVKQTYGTTPTDKELENTRLVAAREAEYRWKRIVMNDLENIPIALIVFATGVGVHANETIQVGAITAFTVARVVHTVVYAKSMQPHRGLAWMAGIAAVLVGVGNTVVTGVLAH